MPTVYVTTLLQGTPSIEYKTLMIGSAEDAQVDVTTEELITSIRSKSGLVTAIGGGSFLYGMANEFWAADVKFQTTLDFIFLAKNATTPTASTRIVPFTGTASEDGSYTISIADRAFTKTVAVTNLDTAEEVAVAFDTAFDEISNFPFIMSNSTGTLTFTSKVHGGIGSEVPLKITGTVAGLTVGTLAGVVGANAPSVSGVKSILDSNQGKYDIIVVEDGVDITPIITMLETYQSISDLDQQGNILIGGVDTYANLLFIPATYNERYVWIRGLKAVTSATETESNHIFATECYFRSYVAGILSVCLTEGVDCSQFLPDIAIGSPNNRSIPFADTVSERYYVTNGEGWALPERENLEAAGVSIVYNNNIGNLVFGNFVTTYTVDSEGNPDEVFHFMNAQLQGQFSNSYFFSRAKLLKHKRLDSKTARNKAVANFSLWYDALSNVQDDKLGERYIILDAGGKTEFIQTLVDTLSITYSTGSMTITKALESILSQLRLVRFFNKFQYL